MSNTTDKLSKRAMDAAYEITQLSYASFGEPEIAAIIDKHCAPVQVKEGEFQELFDMYADSVKYPQLALPPMQQKRLERIIGTLTRHQPAAPQGQHTCSRCDKKTDKVYDYCGRPHCYECKRFEEICDEECT